MIVLMRLLNAASELRVPELALASLRGVTARRLWGLGLAEPVVILLVGVGIYALLAVFLGKGKNWARIVYTVLAAIFGLLGVLGLGGDQPALTMVLGVVQLALITATLFFLWKPESTAWLTGKPTT